MKRPFVNVFIFRRDLRLTDNIALTQLQKLDENILHIFIFNPFQIEKNKYFNKNAIEFMIQSLKELRDTLKDRLYFFHGKDEEVMNILLKHYQINNVGFNLDYTPFAKKRDADLMDWCRSKNINTITGEDYTLFPMGSILSNEGKPYSMFTPFYNKCMSNFRNIPSPNTLEDKPMVLSKSITSMKDIDKIYNYDSNAHLFVKGGRTSATYILEHISYFKNYDQQRNQLYSDKTTKLSAYIKFGCVSIREVFYAIKTKLGKNSGLIRELLWREFFAHIVYHFPNIMMTSFNPRYANITYPKLNQQWWKAWCTGTTGVPLVDAGMRQMIQTGWMHNRARMLVANFLAKDLLIPWWMGEKEFARQLVDYDPSSNIGGWQWTCIGIDGYFRSMNPYIQSQTHDPDCIYIKRYVPELEHVSNRDIHNWYTSWNKYSNIRYPKPIVDHHQQMQKAKRLYGWLHTLEEKDEN